VPVEGAKTSTLVSRQLTSTRLMLCASAEYLWRQGTPSHPSELERHAVYPSRKHLTPKVRVLIDFLVEAFRIRAWPG